MQTNLLFSCGKGTKFDVFKQLHVENNTT